MMLKLIFLAFIFNTHASQVKYVSNTEFHTERFNYKYNPENQFDGSMLKNICINGVKEKIGKQHPKNVSIFITEANLVNRGYWFEQKVDCKYFVTENSK